MQEYNKKITKRKESVNELSMDMFLNHWILSRHVMFYLH